MSPDYSIIAQKAAPTDILERFDTLFTQQYGLTLDALSNRYDAILRQQFSSVVSMAGDVEPNLYATDKPNVRDYSDFAR